jgi:hypothetical protein
MAKSEHLTQRTIAFTQIRDVCANLIFDTLFSSKIPSISPLSTLMMVFDFFDFIRERKFLLYQIYF